MTHPWRLSALHFPFVSPQMLQWQHLRVIQVAFATLFFFYFL